MAKKKSDVHCSVALSYVFGQESPPIIVASGKGFVANKILEIAQEHNIEVVKDSLLSNVLVEQDIGTCIPPETYVAVAAIFAFLQNKVK